MKETRGRRPQQLAVGRGGRGAEIGTKAGVVDMTKVTELQFGGEVEGPKLTGIAALISWRSYYFSRQFSWSNMILVPMFWFKSLVFGRDLSRF